MKALAASILACVGLACCSGESSDQSSGAVSSACGSAQDGQTLDGFPTVPNDCNYAISAGDVSVSQQNIYYGGAWHPKWNGPASCAQCYLHANENHGGAGPATCPANDAGYYICGHDGITGGEASTLYYCNGTSAEPVQGCFLGCHVAPSGESDWCNGTGASNADVGTATFASGSEYDHAVTGD